MPETKSQWWNRHCKGQLWRASSQYPPAESLPLGAVAIDWKWARMFSAWNGKIQLWLGGPNHAPCVFGLVWTLCDHGSSLEPKLCTRFVTQMQPNQAGLQKNVSPGPNSLGSHISHPLFVTMGRSPPGWSVATHSSTDHFWSGRQAPSHRLALRICWRGWRVELLVTLVSSQVASSWCGGLLGLVRTYPKIGYPRKSSAWSSVSVSFLDKSWQIQIP